MAKGHPARGGKGHVTGPSLDTNVSSMTTCTCGSSGERAEEIVKRKYKERGTDITAKQRRYIRSRENSTQLPK